MKQAQKLSSQLNKPKDIEKIKVYLDLIEEFGYPKVKKANNYTAGLKKGNGRYDIETTIRYLK